MFAHESQPHIQRVWLPNEDVPGLAMTRAFGDFDMKSHGIIVTPEVTHRRLTPEDQFLLLACDGVSLLNFASEEPEKPYYNAYNFLQYICSELVHPSCIQRVGNVCSFLYVNGERTEQLTPTHILGGSSSKKIKKEILTNVFENVFIVCRSASEMFSQRKIM